MCAFNIRPKLGCGLYLFWNKYPPGGRYIFRLPVHDCTRKHSTFVRTPLRSGSSNTHHHYIRFGWLENSAGGHSRSLSARSGIALLECPLRNCIGRTNSHPTKTNQSPRSLCCRMYPCMRSNKIRKIKKSHTTHNNHRLIPYTTCKNYNSHFTYHGPSPHHHRRGTTTTIA